MKAARYHGARDIRIEEVPQPGELGHQQLLIAPTWCGICGTDLHEYTQGPIVIPTEPHALNGSELPQILGHEMSAAVVEVGAGVQAIRAGDRVAVMPLIFCGSCYYCVRGLNHLCTRMACTGLSDAWGGIAQLAVVSEYQVARLPGSVTDIQGALVEPTAVAAYGVDRSGVRPGETALITGAGPIGMLAGLYANALGARVIVAEPNARRAEFVKELGIGLVVDPRQADTAPAIRDMTAGVGVDAAIECSGSASGLELCIQSVRSRATVAQTGLHTRPAAIDPMLLSLKDISLVGTWCYPVCDWDRVIRLIAGGRMPVERVVTAQFGMSQVVKAFEALIDPAGEHIKVLVHSG